MPKILILGSGRDLDREHKLASVAAEHDVVLAQESPATWEIRYADSVHRIAADDLTSVLLLARKESVDAVLTWEEDWIETAAATTSTLRLPGHPVPSARACRDKHRLRQAWAAAGVPSAQSVLVTDEVQALRAAAELGYPVVVKPRSGTGGTGVRLVRSPADLARAYAGAAGADGALVQEYLDGPQISVESVLVHSGRLQVVAAGSRHAGPGPGLATASRLISVPQQAEHLASVRRAVDAAHAALGLCEGVTHTEVRLTADGPRLIGLNARLGGDLISRLVPLATGVDLVAAAVDTALGRQPRLRHMRRRTAGIIFRYGDTVEDTVPTSRPARLPDGVESLWTAPEAPTARFGGRIGHAIVVADDYTTCQVQLEKAYAALLPDFGSAIAVLPGSEPSASISDGTLVT
ncbi:ATP-grasp domain-containing protein [Verrucosispora sp. WMMC514]|uniref:ATP-grasp domain-containing protein n=1 Tax=Verrucosispora sp. WMMC514 TaxID=3015156 RepID=UPI00248CFCC8|nr:ATP-grasp domain-containing protein [Verrucosispora sp. WMMC514]WBB92357.1 ATP-grasp domain-containing protein [Verrucosispora sp. WMMC514]